MTTTATVLTRIKTFVRLVTIIIYLSRLRRSLHVGIVFAHAFPSFDDEVGDTGEGLVFGECRSNTSETGNQN